MCAEEKKNTSTRSLFASRLNLNPTNTELHISPTIQQSVCAHSYVHNNREISNSYLTRGFATYESSMWLKPEEVTQPSSSTVSSLDLFAQ